MPAAHVRKRATAATPGASLRLLGELEVERAGERLQLPPSKKTRALLGFLLAEPREHTRERLCQLFWEDPSDPRGALRWSLSRLRQLLKGTGATLNAEQERVSLTLGPAELDLATVRTLSQRGLTKATLEDLEATAALFRGEFLEGLELPDCFRFQAWCTAQRETVRGLRAQVLEALVDRVEEPAAALRHALALVEFEPAGEAGHRRAIRLLIALGRRDEALRQYDLLREALRQLGRRPDRETEAIRLTLSTIPMVAEATPAQHPTVSIPASRAARPLVERKAEWSALRAELTAPPPHRLWMVLGDPGIGKSRLLEELTRAAHDAGQLVLAARSYEAEVGRPYGNFIDAFRAEPRLMAHADAALRPRLALLLPELGTPEPNPDRNRLLDAVTELLRRAARAQPLLLVLDDAQWIDEASAELLHYLVRTLRDEPILFVGAARSGELPDNPSARRLLGALLRQDLAAELHLEPLSGTGVKELLASWGLAADAARVHRASQGNPFFALEVGRALAEGREELSGGLARALDQRVALLEGEARSLLRWASAVGRRWAPSLLAAATERPLETTLEALALLERHGFIRALSDGMDYDFSHDLMREAVWNRVPSPQRPLYHAKIAETLWRQTEGSAASAGAVVRHALAAADRALAARASVAASRHALRSFATGEAMVFAEQGLELLGALPDPERRRAQLALSEVLVSARARPERIQRLAAEVGELLVDAESMGLPDVAAGTLDLLSLMHYFEEDQHRALSDSLRSAEVARRSEDPLLRARSLAQAGRCLAYVELQMDKARELLEEARAEQHGNPAVLLDIPLGLGLVSAYFGELEHARGYFEQTSRVGDAAGDHWRSAEASFALTRMALAASDSAAARANAEKASAVAKHLGGGHEPASARGLLALAHLLSGQAGEELARWEKEFDEAAAELVRLEAFWRQSFLLVLRAELELSRGRFAEALRFAEAGLPKRADEGIIKLAHCRVVQAEACLALGRDGDARTFAKQAAPARLSARLQARLATLQATLDRQAPSGGAHTDLQTPAE